MTELGDQTIKVFIPDGIDAASAVRLLGCQDERDLLNRFRIDGSQVVAVFELNRHYASLNRTFPAFVTATVEQGATVWLLGIEHPEVYLQGVVVRDRSRGIGPQQFAQLARKFAVAGFTHVSTRGVRYPHRHQNPSATEFGYNALPKWGFDGPIPDSSKSALPSTHSQMGDRSIRELLATEGGDELWKDVGDSCELTFDLGRDSTSWRALATRIGQDLACAQGL